MAARPPRQGEERLRPPSPFPLPRRSSREERLGTKVALGGASAGHAAGRRRRPGLGKEGEADGPDFPSAGRPCRGPASFLPDSGAVVSRSDGHKAGISGSSALPCPSKTSVWVRVPHPSPLAWKWSGSKRESPVSPHI